MPELSTVDYGVTPAGISFPAQYNVAFDLIKRNRQAGLSNRTCKVGGACVSPIEAESALITHPALPEFNPCGAWSCLWKSPPVRWQIAGAQ